MRHPAAYSVGHTALRGLSSSSALAILVLALIACQSPKSPPSTLYVPPKPVGRCENVDMFTCDPQDVSSCETRAASGDADAMVRLGKLYIGDFLGCLKYRDGQKSADMFKTASDAGSSEGLRQLYLLYLFGKSIPKNSRIADGYLKEGVERGQDWAVAVNIYHKDESGDPSAANDLLASAISGNCYSQVSMAHFYRTGIIDSPLIMMGSVVFQKIASTSNTKTYPLKPNLTKAYFWALVSVSSNATVPKKKYWDLFGISNAPCPIDRMPSSFDEEKQLGAELVAMAQDAATNWRMGLPEPDLPAPTQQQPGKQSLPQIAAPALPLPAPVPQPPKPPAKIAPPNVPNLGLPDNMPKASSWSWIPVSLPKASTGGQPAADGASVFEKVNKSVWKVLAAKSASELRDGGNVLQGSAVAITRDMLLTNCHVALGMNVIVIQHREAIDLAKVISGSQRRDQCVLRIERNALEPIDGIRSYDSLKVGEKVYTIGSPSGLENTLGEGIVSGLRNKDGQRLVQTSAPISPGSSGGGLFDAAGNLIGVTTFLLRDAQALNFAIAVEEFGK